MGKLKIIIAVLWICFLGYMFLFDLDGSLTDYLFICAWLVAVGSLFTYQWFKIKRPAFYDDLLKSQRVAILFIVLIISSIFAPFSLIEYMNNKKEVSK